MEVVEVRGNGMSTEGYRSKTPAAVVVDVSVHSLPPILCSQLAIHSLAVKCPEKAPACVSWISSCYNALGTASPRQ